jgi:hypothetical protein
MDMFKGARVFGLMAAILAAGCDDKGPAGTGGDLGGDMGDQPGGTADMGGTSSGGFAIAVANADTPYAIEGATAPSGHFFVVVTVTISNTSATPPVSSAAPLFSVKTKAAIVVPSAGFGDACGELSVAPGGKLSCSLMFRVPVGETAAELEYADGFGRTASAPIPLLPAISCDSVQGWKSISSAACMSCIQTANQSCLDLSSCSQTEQTCITSTLQSTRALACRDVVNMCSLSTTCLWRMHRDCLAVACNDACK